jgi:outer membrane protein assembly factor BamB
LDFIKLECHMRQFLNFAFVCLSVGLPMTASPAENWSQFRGDAGNGVVEDAQLPLEWGPDKHVLWKIALPGIGWSQPIVWGDKVFVTTAVSEHQAKPNAKNKGPGLSGYADFLSRGTVAIPPPNETHQWKVMCLDAATGKTLWEKVAREGRPRMTIHANNTYASETPVTDGERIIAYFGMTGVYCYDLSGEPLWTRDLGTRRMQFGWGTGSSPVLYGDLVYIQCDNDEASFLVALDKTTGQDVWRKDRDEKSNWATPYIWRNKLRTELVTAGGKQMRSYDPQSGELLWSMNGNGRTATTPVGNEKLLFVDSYDRLTGLGGYLAAVRPGGSGDISLGDKQASSEHVAWTAPIKGGRMASPALCQDFLFALEHGGGVVRCFDAKTGAEHYRQRLPEASGVTSSPIVIGDKVYCTDQNCKTFVLQAGKELQVLATNDLGEFCWSSPAVAGDTLLIRTVDHLIAIGPSRSNAAPVE